MSQPKIFYRTPNNGTAVRCAQVDGQIVFHTRDLSKCFKIGLDEWDPYYQAETKSVLIDGRKELFVTGAGMFSIIPPGPGFYKSRQMAIELLQAPDPAPVVPLITETEKAG